MTSRDPSRYVPWLMSRAAGIVAFALVAAAVVLGLSMAAGLSRRPGAKRVLVKLHEQIALAALLAMLAHGLLLLGDGWLKLRVTDVLVPFAMRYRPAFTGVGILGAYLAVLLGLSFYARRRIGARRWRVAHRLVVVVYVLGAVHALGAGSDGSGVYLRAIVAASAVPIAGLLMVRASAGKRAGAAGTPARRPAAARPR